MLRVLFDFVLVEDKNRTDFDDCTARDILDCENSST